MLLITFKELVEHILDWIHRMLVTFGSHKLSLTAVAVAVAVFVAAVVVADGIESGLVAFHMGQILGVAHYLYEFS